MPHDLHILLEVSLVHHRVAAVGGPPPVLGDVKVASAGGDQETRLDQGDLGALL